MLNVHYNDVTINSDVIVVSYRAMFQNGQVGFKWAISLERKSFQVSTSWFKHTTFRSGRNSLSGESMGGREGGASASHKECRDDTLMLEYLYTLNGLEVTSLQECSVCL